MKTNPNNMSFLLFIIFDIRYVVAVCLFTAIYIPHS